MSVTIIEKDTRPEKGSGKDNEVIKLSKAQHDPYLASPEDFEIQDATDGVLRETPAHGQHGRNSAEYRKLLQKSAANRGKSAFRKPG